MVDSSEANTGICFCSPTWMTDSAAETTVLSVGIRNASTSSDAAACCTSDELVTVAFLISSPSSAAAFSASVTWTSELTSPAE